MRSNNRLRDRYFTELEENCQLGLAKESTFAQRKKAVNYFVSFLNKEKINLKNLNSQHLHNFVHYLNQIVSIRGQKLAAATVKQIYALVRTFYIRCYEQRYVTQHPDLIFTKNLIQRYKLGQRRLPKYINQERMSKLLTKCPDKWKALLHFMYETGARISEVLNVQLEHIDFKTRQVQIFEPKTMNIRVTSLSQRTIRLLEEYFTTYRPQPRTRYESFLFINQQRRKMLPRAVQYLVKNVSSKILGSEHAITPHYFRAACAVHLLEEGVDIRQVQEIIGWKSLSVVQNYTRVTPQRQTELKERYHPSFRFEEKKSLIIENQEPSQASLTKMLQRLMEEQERKNQQKINEMKQFFQQKEQKYEQQISELLKSQQQLINKLLTEK
ncbi:MAG: tyrosine-type recombinase/integrase [Candidatus Hodarchaeota archaeon]